MKTTLSLVLVSMILISGCGTNTPGRVPGNNNTGGPVSTPEKKLQMQGAEYIVLDGAALTAEDSSVSGTGKIILKDSLPEEDSHYSLSFTLKDGGSLALVSHSNASLENGVSFIFGRNANTLTATLKVGSESYDLSEDFTSVNASTLQNFEIEVHGHGHLIVGLGNAKLEYSFSTKVPGRLWGLSLKDVTVTKAQASKATEEQ